MAGTLRKNVTSEMRQLIEGVVKKYGSVASRKEIITFASDNGIQFDWWLFGYPFKSFKVSRGSYDLKAILAADDDLRRSLNTDVEVTQLNNEVTVS